MRVIFIKDVRNVGRMGELKDVAEGYARNFLIPNGLAKPATAEAVKGLEAKKESEKKDIETLQHKLAALIKSSIDSPLIVKVKVGERKEVFGGVHAKEIEAEIVKRGFTGATAELSRPLKTLGKHNIKVNLGKGIVGEIAVLLEPL